jgi:uncharacterized membrane protein
MAEAEYPPKTILIGLVLIAVLAIGTLVGMVIHLNNLESRPEALEGAAFEEGLRQAAGAASQEAQAATGFLNPNTGQSAESS